MKKNYIMKKLDRPKRVTLNNGRTFVARFKRVKRSELPDNIIMRRTHRNNYAKGARKKWTGGRRGRKSKQTGKGFFSTLKKIAKNPILRDIARTGAKYLPGLYRGGVSKIKNKNLKKVWGSDLASRFIDNLLSRL